MNRFLFFIAVFVLLFTSCHQVTLQVDQLPDNTPLDANIYVCGNFNNWYAGDRNFLLEKNKEGIYSIALPKGSGKLQYKFTRGNIATTEGNPCGGNIDPRTINYRNDDTVRVRIQSWRDLEPLNCDNITFVLRSVPDNTPFGDSITLIGTFNNWDASNGNYTFHELSDGTRQLTIRKGQLPDYHEFKFSRGNLFAIEGNRLGNSLPNRSFRFGEKDTLFLDIQSWEDIYGRNEEYRYIVIKNLPKSTPRNSEIYVAGNFNGWYPRDEKTKFTPTKNQLVAKIPKGDMDLEFKITRGDWSSQEVEESGKKRVNRKWAKNQHDTLYVEVENWFDKLTRSQDYVTIIIDQLPHNTPHNSDLYIAGGFNNWKSGDPKYKLNRRLDGKYGINLQREATKINFKFNRGSDDLIEVDRYGNHIVDRFFRFNTADTLKVRIDNWLDLATWRYNQVTILIRKLPEGTLWNESIYLMGNFNNWKLQDPIYKMKKNRRGEYHINIPRERNGKQLEFNFNRRGGIALKKATHSKNASKYIHNYGLTDKLFIDIDSWQDL